MRKPEFGESIGFKCSINMRKTIEAWADRRNMSLGAATRELLSEGIAANGIEVENEAMGPSVEFADRAAGP